MNAIRMEFIKNGLVNVGFKSHNTVFPLEGIKIADVGCGSGILSECLAGAHITGIDAATDFIDIAKEHVKLNFDILNRIDYKY